MSVQVKGSGTIGGIDEGLVVSGIVTATKVLSEGTSNSGGIFGKLSVGVDDTYLTIQPVSGQSQLHLNFNNGSTVHIGHSSPSSLTVNGNIVPKTDSDRDLGLTGTRFRSAYVDTYYGDGSNLTGITATNVTVADESSDTTCFPTFVTAATGNLPPKTGSNLTFNSSNGTLTATGLIGGNLSVGGVYNNTIQNTVSGTVLHIQYNNSGDIRCNEGGGSMQTHTIFPESNDAYSLGTNTKRWANIHTNDLNLSNEGSVNDVDGTWGNYTIQEGESDLFLINRRNGKRYKFNLTEID